MRARVGVAIVIEASIAAVILCWLLGRLISDRMLWSQYLGWLPTEAVVAGAVAGCIGSVLLRGRRRRRAAIPITLSLVTATIVAWMLVAEWHMLRLARTQTDPSELRVVFMNISPEPGTADLSPVFDAQADLVVLSNVHPQPITFEKIYGFAPPELLERTIGIAPGDAPPGEAHLVRYGMFHVTSRHPIRRRAVAYVGEQDSWLDEDVGGGGGVLMLEVDAPGGPITIWAVDMPRTLGASRRDLFAEVREKTDATTRAHAIDSVGRWIARDIAPDDPLLAPDLIVGDFNTPSHAWSVRQLGAGLRLARADAGIGPTGTFPAATPIFEIDFAMLADTVRVADLSRLTCDGCRHLGLILDLAGEGPARASGPRAVPEPKND